jgi:integrase
MPLHYRKAKVYRGSNGTIKDAWHVYYFFLNPETSKMVRFKVYEDINRQKTLEERESYAAELVININKALSDGFNPFDYERSVVKKIEAKEKINYSKHNPKSPLLTEAFREFLEVKRDKNLSPQTIQAYETFISGFENWLIDNQIADIRINKLDISLIKSMLAQMQRSYGWSGTTYNNYLNFWVTLLNWFSKKPRNWINRDDFNIGEDGELEKKESRPMKHQYFGDTIFNKVKEAMAPFPKMLFYSKFIYYSCMRPEEIRQLKIENVDISGRYIKIVGKTKSRTVPICDELAEMLKSLSLEDYPAYYYVIGKNGEVSSATHSENYFSRVFREEIKEKLGLSKDFTLYGMKHTRVVSLLNAGYSDAEIMNLTGHRDTASYDKYKRDLVGHIKTRLKGKTVSW